RICCNRVGGSQINRRKGPLAVEIRGDLIDVAPELRIISRAARIEDANDLPLSFGKIEIVADVGAGKTIVNGLPDDNFALPGRKPPASDQLCAGTQREA